MGDAMRKEMCPYCWAECEAEWVHVGIGYVQITPFECPDCYARQIGPYDEPDGVTTAWEREVGWYAPLDVRLMNEEIDIGLAWLVGVSTAIVLWIMVWTAP